MSESSESSESSELAAFRAEARSWLEANAPAAVRGVSVTAEGGGNWGGKRAQYDVPEMQTWLEVMGQKGWTAPTWPVEYGGGGLSAAEAKALGQELGALSLPPPLIGFGLEMIGPTILRYGTEEQKRQHLPKIVRGEIRWCQGYSEPDSGSDLASLQTKAIVDGDDYVINGTKVWTSYGDLSDWIFALVRTDPNVKKQEGITFILIDMESPGVSVRPILLISGKSPFCETRFDDVRVPRSNVLSEVNGGWTVAKALLGYERNMIADTFGAAVGGKKKSASSSDKSDKSAASSDKSGKSASSSGKSNQSASSSGKSNPPSSRLAGIARDFGLGANGKLGDPVLRDDIAQLEMDERAFLLTVQRSRDAARAGQQPGAESSLFKVYATELNKDRFELMVRLAGPQGLGWEGPGYTDDEINLTRAWLRSRGNSIEGGTSEVQLNIIAKHVLGLPE